APEARSKESRVFEGGMSPPRSGGEIRGPSAWAEPREEICCASGASSLGVSASLRLNLHSRSRRPFLFQGRKGRRDAGGPEGGPEGGRARPLRRPEDAEGGAVLADD